MTLGTMLRAAVSRKPVLVPTATQAPRLESTTGPVRLRAGLQPYLDVIGWQRPDVPPTWPHVLASAMHLELLARPAFPVRLIGLVHLANRIDWRAPLHADDEVTLSCWLEGHRDTERGQEFDLHTELHRGAEVPWVERTTFLARRKSDGRKPRPAPVERPPAERVVEFEAPAGLGRRYGWIANDLNPIHLTNLTARAFGFPRAIAHGMWSLARSLGFLELSAPAVIDCQFKLPVLLPAQLRLEVRGEQLGLYDARGEKPHFSASIHRT